MKPKTRSLLVGVCLLAGMLGTMPALGQAKKPEPMKLAVGDVAPDFKLQYFDGSDDKEISLSQYRGKKNVVLAFYIFAFTGG